MQQTFVMIKPDAMDRGLAGEIISRFERKGLRPIAMKLVHVDEKLARAHYAEHVEKGFFPDLLSFIMSRPVLAMVFAGTDSIAEVRRLVGKTNPREAAPGTIRGDFGLVTTYNMVHASDSEASALREIELWFDQSSLPDWERSAGCYFKA